MGAELVGNVPDADWVGCLVLVCAREDQLGMVVESVARAQERILADPILADLALVGASRVLAVEAAAEGPAQVDDVEAGNVYRALVGWGQSVARTFAPRVTFGLLVVDADAGAAAAAIRRLASSPALATLPVVFRSCASRAEPDSTVQQAAQGDLKAVTGKVEGYLPGGAGPAPVQTEPRSGAEEDDDPRLRAGPDSSSEGLDVITRSILDTVDVVAREADRRPDFRVDITRVPLSPPLLNASAAAEQDPGTLTAETSQAQEPRDERRGGVLTRAASALAPLFTRRPAQPVPTSSIPAPQTTVRRMNLLHLVASADMVQPPVAIRRRRTEAAVGLDRAARALEAKDRWQPWHVRLFTAGSTVRPVDFPEPGRRRHSSLPEQWGEDFDLCECVPEMIDWIERDISSCRRRGVSQVFPHVVILADELPLADSGTMERYRELCQVASVSWLLFMQDRDAISEQFLSARSRLFHDHEDIINELVTNALATATDVTAPTPGEATVGVPSAVPEGDQEGLVTTQAPSVASSRDRTAQEGVIDLRGP